MHFNEFNSTNQFQFPKLSLISQSSIIHQYHNSHLVNLLGPSVVGGEPEHLGEVAEGAVHVILVVKAQTPHVDGIGVHVVDLEDRVGRLRGLGISAQEGQALRPRRLDGGGVVGELQGLVQAPE